MFIKAHIPLHKPPAAETQNFQNWDHITLPKTRKQGKKIQDAHPGADLLAHTYHCNSIKQDQQIKNLSFLTNLSVGKHSIPSSQMYLKLVIFAQESAMESRKDLEISSPTAAQALPKPHLKDVCPTCSQSSPSVNTGTRYFNILQLRLPAIMLTMTSLSVQHYYSRTLSQSLASGAIAPSKLVELPSSHLESTQHVLDIATT